MALALYDAKADETRLLTQPQFMLGAFEWAGQQLVYTGHAYTKVKAKTRGMYAYDMATDKRALWWRTARLPFITLA